METYHLELGEAVWRILITFGALVGTLWAMYIPGIRGVVQPLRNELDAACESWLPQGSGPTTFLGWWRSRREKKRDEKLAKKGYTKAAPPTLSQRASIPLDIPKAIGLCGLIFGNSILRCAVLFCVTWVMVAK